MLFTTNVFAIESLNCFVQKFYGETYDLSKDKITFKNQVDTNKIMLIDQKGLVKLADDLSNVDLHSTQVGVVSSDGDLVIVANQLKKVEAVGYKSAILVDKFTGLTVGCSKN